MVFFYIPSEKMLCVGKNDSLINLKLKNNIWNANDNYVLILTQTEWFRTRRQNSKDQNFVFFKQLPSKRWELFKSTYDSCTCSVIAFDTSLLPKKWMKQK